MAGVISVLAGSLWQEVVNTSAAAARAAMAARILVVLVILCGCARVRNHKYKKNGGKMYFSLLFSEEFLHQLTSEAFLLRFVVKTPRKLNPHFQ